METEEQNESRTVVTRRAGIAQYLRRAVRLGAELFLRTWTTENLPLDYVGRVVDIVTRRRSHYLRAELTIPSDRIIFVEEGFPAEAFVVLFGSRFWFRTRICRTGKRLILPERVVMPVLLDFPSRMESRQRRDSFRVQPSVLEGIAIELGVEGMVASHAPVKTDEETVPSPGSSTSLIYRDEVYEREEEFQFPDEGVVMNISISGLGFRVDTTICQTTLEVGDLVRLRFWLPDVSRPIILAGVVQLVRKRPRINSMQYGVRFMPTPRVRMADEDIDAIGHYVARRQQEQLRRQQELET